MASVAVLKFACSSVSVPPLPKEGSSDVGAVADEHAAVPGSSAQRPNRGQLAVGLSTEGHKPSADSEWLSRHTAIGAEGEVPGTRQRECVYGATANEGRGGDERERWQRSHFLRQPASLE